MKKQWMADEMEMSINFKAVRAAWVYSILFLLVWNLISLFKNGDVDTWAFILLTSETAVMLSVKLMLTKKMSGETEDDE